MENYKQYLSDNADDSEQEAARQVLDGLSRLQREKKVAEAASERRLLLRRQFWSKVLGLTALVALGIALYWGYARKDAALPSITPPQTAPSMQQDPPVATPGQKPVENTPLTKAQEPIAQVTPSKNIAAPRFPSPNVRGENQENKAWKAQLDQVWYADYPPAGVTLNTNFSKAGDLLKARDFTSAYVQIQRLERKMPENDTLLLLKGYCLMQMGEGAEALTYLKPLGRKQASWNASLQWYEGLNYLLTGDREKALSAFRQISAQTGHPYHEQAQKALRVIK